MQVKKINFPAGPTHESRRMEFAGALLLALLSLCCWGSWSNAAKAAAHLPFPHFYLDFAIGVWLSACLAFITVGERHFYHDNPDGGSGRIVAGLAAGAVFNVANVLLVAGVQLAGLAVAFPVGIGTALVLGTLLTYAIDRRSTTPALLFLGVCAAFIAILLLVRADRERPRKPAGCGGGGSSTAASNPIEGRSTSCDELPAAADGAYGAEVSPNEAREDEGGE